MQRIKPTAVENRSSHPEVLCKKAALKNLAKFIENTLCQSLFFNKVAVYKATLAQVFLCEYCEILKTSFFIEHLRWLLVVKLEPLKSAKFEFQLFLPAFNIMRSLYIVTK